MFRFSASGQIGSATVSASGEVRSGEALLVTGPSGAGKTTLLRMLAGLHPLTEGSISLGEADWNGPSIAVPPESRNVGFVFQDSALFPTMTALENVAFGLPRGAMRDSPDDLLASVGLASRKDAKAATLSGGESQRVAICRALARGPSLLLLDEPLTALDYETAQQTAQVIAASIEDLAIPAVIVAHESIPHVRFADTALQLEAGRTAASVQLEDALR